METTERTAPPSAPPRAPARPESRGFTVRWRNPERGLADYLSAVWARRRGLLILALVCGFAGLIYALRKPNTYASRATLMIHGTASVRSTADAAANLLGTGSILPTQVMTAVEVIHSRVVLRRVVERVGFQEILRPYQPSREATLAAAGLVDRVIDKLHELHADWFAPAETDFSRYSEDSLVSAAVETLEQNLVVEPSPVGTTVALVYQHTSPSGAERILRAVVDESIRRYSDVVSPPEGKDWLDVKVREAEQAEDEARGALDRFAEKNGTTDLSQVILTLSTTAATLQGSVHVARMKKEEHERVLESLRAEIEKPSARSSAAHYATLETGIQTREIELLGLETPVPLLEKSLDEAQTTLETKRSLQREVDRIQGDLREATAQLKRLREVSKTYEISNELDVRGLTNLRVVEPPDVPRTKAGPRRASILLGATFGALLVGFSVVMLRARLDRKLKSSRDVMFALGRSDVVSTPELSDGNLQRFEEARRRGWE